MKGKKQCVESQLKAEEGGASSEDRGGADKVRQAAANRRQEEGNCLSSITDADF